MPASKQFSQTIGAKVLVVDDNDDLIKLMRIRLKPLKLELKTASSAEEALSVLSLWTPHLIITDLQLPGMSGMELFESVHMRNPLLPVIVLTAHGTIPDAVAATQAGVATFLSKPFDGKALMQEIQSALLTSGFAKQAKPKGGQQQHIGRWRDHIAGNSSAMEPVFSLIDRFAPTDSLLIFEGEIGTGKSDLAEAAHERSQCANGPIKHISCASLPEEYLEKEIYGKVGSGTDAQPELLGLLRDASGGTFLLTEFNKASPVFLQKLLRSVIANKANPIDSDTEYPIDMRAMATTTSIGELSENSKRTWEMTAKLDITVIQIPPLRDHREDIPRIAYNFLETLALKDTPKFSSKAMQLLTSAEWPGNIYQLISVVRQCARLCRTKVISDRLVNSRLNTPAFTIQPLTSAHKEFERNYLTEVLKATNGNVTKAADMAKRNRTEFHRLLKKHQIEASSFRQYS